MADEENGQVEVQAEVDPVAEVAKELGWNPDYDGENAIGAKDFILKSREIQDTQRKHAKTLERKLETVNEGLESLKKHNERVYKAEIAAANKEIADLKKERREAIVDGNPDLVDEIDGKIKDTEARAQDDAPASTAEAPALAEWREANPWYEKDKDRTTYANRLNELYMKDPKMMALSYPKYLKKIEAAVKEQFPDEKKEPEPTPSGVEGAGHKVRTGTKKGAPKVSDLDSETRDLMRQYIRTGAYKDEAEFLKEYASFSKVQ